MSEQPQVGAKPPQGRVEGGQEAVQRPELVSVRMSELVLLARAAKDAQDDFSAAVKETAKVSGFLAKSVRALALAKASEKEEQRKREAQQLGLLFDEVR